MSEEKSPLLTDYLEEFFTEFEQQLISDHGIWGDTWLQRSPHGQEERTLDRYRDYWDQFYYGNTPIPWLKVIGNAYICWVRERHPELFA